MTHLSQYIHSNSHWLGIKALGIAFNWSNWPLQHLFYDSWWVHPRYFLRNAEFQFWFTDFHTRNVVGWSEPDFQASVGCALIVRSVPDSLAVMVKLIRWAFREKVKTGSWNKSNLCAITIWTKVHRYLHAAVILAELFESWDRGRSLIGPGE